MTDWADGLSRRETVAIAEQGFGLAVLLLPCLCGADLVEASTHTHMPGATCPANFRTSVAATLCALIRKSRRANLEPEGS